jgi:hypothetical protein
MNIYINFPFFLVQDEKKKSTNENYLENRVSLASVSKRGFISFGGTANKGE